VDVLVIPAHSVPMVDFMIQPTVDKLNNVKGIKIIGKLFGDSAKMCYLYSTNLNNFKCLKK
jgi:hypothetical protein